MRCPACEFVSADSRDICPKCFDDLRPHKESIGLEISDKAASYVELATKAGAPDSIIAAYKPRKAGPSLFSKFFRSSKVDQSNKPATIQEVSPTVITPDVTPPTPPISEGLESAQQVSQNLKEAVVVPEMSVAQDEVPKKEPPPPVVLNSRIFKSPPDPTDLDGINTLFDESSAELATLIESSTVELTSENLLDGVDKATVALFDLAYEIVQSPERENVLVEHIKTSDEAQVEANYLSEELAQVERRLSLPVFGLKSIQARVASARQKESAEPIVDLQRANALQQLLAFGIDMVAIIIIGAVFSLALFYLSDRQLFERLSEVVKISRADLVSLNGVSLAFSLVLLIIYPIFCLLIFRRTLGQYICKVRVLTELGRKLRIPHVFVRSMTLPLNCLCGGYLLVFFKGRCLHDAVARTKVCREAKA